MQALLGRVSTQVRFADMQEAQLGKLSITSFIFYFFVSEFRLKHKKLSMFN